MSPLRFWQQCLLREAATDALPYPDFKPLGLGGFRLHERWGHLSRNPTVRLVRCVDETYEDDDDGTAIEYQYAARQRISNAIVKRALIARQRRYRLRGVK